MMQSCPFELLKLRKGIEALHGSASGHRTLFWPAMRPKRPEADARSDVWSVTDSKFAVGHLVVAIHTSPISAYLPLTES